MGKANRPKNRQASPGARQTAIKRAATELEKASGEAFLAAMIVIDATAEEAGEDCNPPDIIFGSHDPVVARLRQIALGLNEAASALRKEQ